SHYDMLHRLVRTTFPIVRLVTHITDILHTNFTGPEAGGYYVTEFAKKSNPRLHPGLSDLEISNLIQHYLMLIHRTVYEFFIKLLAALHIQPLKSTSDRRLFLRLIEHGKINKLRHTGFLGVTGPIIGGYN